MRGYTHWDYTKTTGMGCPFVCFEDSKMATPGFPKVHRPVLTGVDRDRHRCDNADIFST